MKLIKPSFKELSVDGINPLLLGEQCIRVCYKSENLIKDGSAEKLIQRIIDNGHTAMLEHIPVYLKISKEVFDDKEIVKKLDKLIHTKYGRYIFYTQEDVICLSTNLRVLHETDKDLAIEFLNNNGNEFTFKKYSFLKSCNIKDPIDNIIFKKRITILFTMDRIGSQSFCRHRVFSFAQESTRWCNYLKEKFGSEISIITPCWLNKEDENEFIEDMKLIESLYFKWVNKGYKSEDARAFLPFGLKTEIIMTGFVDDWEHFFELRNDKHAHIQAQELAKPLQEYFLNKNYKSDIVGLNITTTTRFDSSLNSKDKNEEIQYISRQLNEKKDIKLEI